MVRSKRSHANTNARMDFSVTAHVSGNKIGTYETLWSRRVVRNSRTAPRELTGCRLIQFDRSSRRNGRKIGRGRGHAVVPDFDCTP